MGKVLFKLILAMSSHHITDILQSLEQLPLGLAATFFSSATSVIRFGPENSLFNNSKMIIIFKFSAIFSHIFLYSESTRNLQGLSATSCLWSSLFLTSLPTSCSCVAHQKRKIHHSVNLGKSKHKSC